MAENKIIRILQTLVAKSREGEVAWETTRSSSKFLSIYSSVSITIESDETPPEFYSLGVLNDNGVEVDSIQFTESDNYYLIAIIINVSTHVCTTSDQHMHRQQRRGLQQRACS